MEQRSQKIKKQEQKQKQTRSSMMLSDTNKAKETRVNQASMVYHFRSANAC